MKIEYDHKNREIVVTKEPGDRKYPATGKQTGWTTDPEGTLLYHVQKWLNEHFIFCCRKIRWIKKRMCKDGHLVDEYQQYIRTSKPVPCIGGTIAFSNWHYAITGLNDDFNKDGKAVIHMEII